MLGTTRLRITTPLRARRSAVAPAAYLRTAFAEWDEWMKAAELKREAGQG